jgi:hypothetical protein
MTAGLLRKRGRSPIEKNPVRPGGLRLCWYDDGMAGPRLVRLRLWAVGQWLLVGRAAGLAQLALERARTTWPASR